MVFYADLLFLLNLLIDFVILWTSGKFLHLPMKKWRLLLGSSLGAIYTFIFFFPSLTFFHVLITKILVSGIMVWISFGFVHLAYYIRAFATFYFVSFIFGGGVFGLQYLLEINHEVVNGIYVSRSSSPFILLSFIFLAFLGIWLFSNKTFYSLQKKNVISKQIVEIEIFLFQQSFQCNGLIDTGNQLHDPISRKPVIVVEAKAIPFLPDELNKAYVNRQFQIERFEEISEQIEPEWLTRIQFIPFRSVGKEMEFLLTIRPDKVVIRDGNTQLTSHKVLIGLDYGQLSIDESYQAVLHPELFIAS